MKARNIHDVFSEVAGRHGESIAAEGAGRRVTYAELEAKSNRVANFLLEGGAEKGSLVVVLMDDRVEAVAAVIGILKAGCVFVPLETTIPVKRLEMMMADVRPSWYLLEHRHRAKLRQVGAGEGRARAVCVDREPSEEEAGDEGAGMGVEWVRGYTSYEREERVEVESGPDDMCYVYFTSGSTGRPKAIAGRMKGIDHFIRWEVEALGVREGARVSQLQALSFDGSLRDIFVPLSVGGTICVPESREVVIDGAGLVRFLDEARVELIHCVPSLLRRILNEELTTNHFAALRHVVLAGEALLPADVGRWVDLFGESKRLVNLYGTSETTMAKFFYFVQEEDRHRPSIPIGKPMPGARAVVVDRDGTPCPPKAVGEIYIRTPYRTLGYYNQPELTREVFIQNPFSNDPDDIVHKTGDLGRVLDDGNFEYLGRKDEQVKVRGVRVELREVEDVLRRASEVKDVAVIDLEDREGERYLCAYVVVEGVVRPGRLREHMSDYLPDYMMPSRVVVMDQLPRTISGKVDRRALPRAEREQEEEARNKGGRQMERLGPIEEVVMGIWRTVLGVSRLGVEDNFFEAGGHSLLATQVMTRVRNTLEVELPLQTIFEAPTVASLSARVEGALREGAGLSAPPVTRVGRDGPMELSYGQQRLWFLDQMAPGNPFYNITAGMRLEGELSREAVEQALGEIVRRHEALRTRYETGPKGPVQVVEREAGFRLGVVDLERLEEVEREEVAARLGVEEGQRAFDLRRSPVIRAVLMRKREMEHVVVVSVHHIASDAWSMDVLVGELGALYGAYSRGEGKALREPEVQYADYAAWQRGWLQGEVLERQVEYWRRQLKGCGARTEIPADKPRPAVQSFRGASEVRVYGDELVEGLEAVSHAEGASLYMTLLGGFVAMMHHYTGREEVVVGTNTANRGRQEVEGMIGFFINTLAVRVEVNGEWGFAELLRRVREVCLGAYMHEDVPFERVVKEVAPERELSRQPLFGMIFDMHSVGWTEWRGAAGGAEAGGLRMEVMRLEERVSQYDIVFNVWEEERKLGVGVRYNTDVYERETIEGMVERYKTILDHIAANPNISISDLALSAEEEDQELSRDFKMTLEAY